GMPLAEISQVLDGQTSDIKALLEQRQRLQITQEQIAMQIRSVDATIAALEKGQTIMPQDMFAGFNHAKYDAEVRERWGDAAADRSNAWWSDLGTSGQEDFRQQLEALNSGWDEIIAAGVEPDAESAQQMAAGISTGLDKSFRARNCQKPRSKASRKWMLTASVLPPTTTGCHQRVHSSSEMPYTTGLITTSVTKDFKATLRYDISHIRLLSLLS